MPKLEVNKIYEDIKKKTVILEVRVVLCSYYFNQLFCLPCLFISMKSSV